MNCINRNGDITSYSVQYAVQGSWIAQIVYVPGGATTETTISVLKANTTYCIEVAAVNVAGSGVYSDSTPVRT